MSIIPDLNLRSAYAEFHRPIQSKVFPVFPYSQDFMIQDEVKYKSRCFMYIVWILLITGSIREMNLFHDEVDAFRVLCHAIQITQI